MKQCKWAKSFGALLYRFDGAVAAAAAKNWNEVQKCKVVTEMVLRLKTHVATIKPDSLGFVF